MRGWGWGAGWVLPVQLWVCEEQQLAQAAPGTPRAPLTSRLYRPPTCTAGVKYKVKAVRQGPQSLRLHLGGTWVDVVVRQLNDGGLLVQVDGSSHVVHSEGEALGTRLTIDSFTCLLSNEHDPSQVRRCRLSACSLLGG